jgi:hypothetical protein
VGARARREEGGGGLMGTQELHYTVTDRDYVDGMAAVLDTFDFGRRAVRNLRLYGVFLAVVALLWWFGFALDPGLLSVVLAIACTVGAVVVVARAKLIVEWSDRRRLVKIARRDALVPVGPYRARITEDGLHEESAAASVMVAWSSVERVVETDRAQVVKAGGQVVVLPKQPDPGATASFASEIRSRAKLA